MNGVILYRDGSGYVGQINSEGKREGHGTFIDEATDIQYDGEWFDDYWHGEGHLYSVRDMTVLHGIWQKGELVDVGVRKDLKTGCKWAEGYNDKGVLITHGLISVDNEQDSSDMSSIDESPRSAKSFTPPIIPSPDPSDGRREARTYSMGRLGARPLSRKGLWSMPEKSDLVKEAKKRGVKRLDTSSFLRCARLGQQFCAHGDFARCPCQLKSSEFCRWLRNERLTSKELISYIGRHKLTFKDLVNDAATLAEHQYGLQVEIEELRKALDGRLSALTDMTCIDPDFVIPFHEIHFESRIDGAGSCSTYRATWLGKLVAVKVFTGLLQNYDAWVRFTKIISTVNHPNLVQILGVSMKPPYLWCVVSEYMSRGSLQQFLKTTPRRRDNLNFADNSHNATGSSMPLTFENVELWDDNVTVLTAGGGYSSTAECMHRGTHLDHLLSLPADHLLRLRTNKTYSDSLSNRPSVGPAAPYAITSPSISPVPLIARPRPNSSPRGAPAVSLDTSNIVVILKAIVQALLYLQSKSDVDEILCHGNIKPSNVFLTEQLDAKIGDYCEYLIERAFQPLLLDLEPPGVSCNRCGKLTETLFLTPTVQKKTVNWLAPEYLRFPIISKCDTPAGDVYSFGATAASLLQGRVPYAGLSATQIRLFRGFSNVPPRFTKLWQPMKPLIECCLQQKPEDRPTWEAVCPMILHFRHTASVVAENALLTFMDGSDLTT